MKTIARIVAVGLVALPFVAGAQSVSELQAQIQDLLNRISVLQQQLGSQGATSGTVAPTGTQGTPSSSSTSVCPFLGKTLKLGSSGDDVSRLQQFLARDPSIYPEGTVSGYYGSLTEAAVKRWQAKNNIVSSGSADSTGYGVVGPRTAAAMSVTCSGSNVTNTPGVVGVNTSPVGGFIQVTPISGNAPLAVSIQVTVNTTQSCTGATYTVNYGDGSIPTSIAVPVGNCNQLVQTVGHTYQYGGTYKITLASGDHNTSATVTVTGPAAPTTGIQTPVTTVPRGTLSSFVTSGPAPFTTTFYISCGAGIAYNVVFGDGTELGSAGVADSTCTGSLQSVQHTYTSPGSYNAQLAVFIQQTNGTIIPVTIASLNMSATSGSSSGLSSLSITPNVGGNPQQVEARFDVGNCQQYTVEWGDGQTSAATPACTGSNSNITVDHTYQGTGSYTIRVTRGSKVDTVAITISN